MGKYQVTSGIQEHAKRVVVYGPENSGKTCFAAQFPNCVFIDVEGSTKNYDVKRLPSVTSYAMLLDMLDDVKKDRIYSTVVIDSLDVLEKMIKEDLLVEKNWKSIEDPPYGAGYVYWHELFGKLLNKLDELIDAGINVVLVCHHKIVRFEQPDAMGTYDRYQLKLLDSPRTSNANLTKEWADMVIFTNFKTEIYKIDGKYKATGGQIRMMYTERTSAFDAKNRYGLPAESELNFGVIAHLFQNVKPIDNQSIMVQAPQTPQLNIADNVNTFAIEEPASNEQVIANGIDWNAPIYQTIPKNLLDLMKANNLDECAIRKVSANCGYFTFETPISNYPPDYVQHIINNAEQFIGLAKQAMELPF